jgi:glycosyltransferase involved in cell wall biosynthesis
LKILVLSFYFQPDLCAGSFRSTALVNALCQKLEIDDTIEIITTMPNRYKSLRNPALLYEKKGNVIIRRIHVPDHEGGFIDQAFAFWKYWKKVRQLTDNQYYDLVYATSARLFTAFLGAKISNIKRVKLYLDIRDILSDTVRDIIKNSILKYLLLPIIYRIEKYTIQSAIHLNLVSEGFRDYFVDYTGKTTFFTNGIDATFLENDFEKLSNNEPKIITYAGNIGEGQGLEKIIPEAARRLKGKYVFNIIGDGSTKRKLLRKLADLQIDNINIVNPVNRDELLKYYQKTDFLFLHLNNYEAFKKVLPSKIFEYGATEKPIIAGVDGYARAFIKENLNDALIFEPSNVEEFIEILENHKPQLISREDFIEKFSRETIFDEMTDTILELIPLRRIESI